MEAERCHVSTFSRIDHDSEPFSDTDHFSDVEMDQESDRKKGGSEHDKLFRIQPLFDHVRAACKASYHPRRQLAIDERIVATKAKTGFTQYMKNKPTKWGIKLFVLADSSNGYTVDFTL